MDTTYYTLRDVADLLGEPLHSARNWSRLDADNPRHLPTIVATGDDGRIARRVISRENLARWLRGNPDLAERVLGLYAPPEVRETLLPLARATTIAHDLRGTTPPEPTNHWWLPVDHDHQDQTTTENQQ